MTTLSRRQYSIVDQAGNVIPGASIEVRQALVSGQPLALLYADRSGSPPLSNPFFADSNGFAFFHTTAGVYNVRAYTGPSGAPTFQQTWQYVAVGTTDELDNSTDGTLAAASDLLVPTQHAVKTYVDTTLGTGSSTISNKIIDNSNTVTLKDTLFTLQDDGDVTKQLRFQLSGIATATLRTITVPDASTVMVGTDTAQTLSNKTLDTAASNILKVNGNTLAAAAGTATVSLPNSSDTLVARSTTDTLANKSINASNNTISNLTTTMFAANVVDNDSTLSAASSTRLPTQAAVKAYADQIIASADAMVFKGVIDCSASPNYPAADRGWTYKVSVAGKIGGASGVAVDIGDTLMCITDGTASGNQATVGAAWNIVQANLVGAVTGPASSISGNIPTFNGTGGTVIQDSGKALPAGTVVGTTDAQTLTNKTLTSPALTTPTIAGGAASALTGLAIRSTGAAFDLTFANTEVLTAGRQLTLKVNDANRTLNLSGDMTIAGAFTMSGAFTFVGTLTANTTVTFPTTGTLATLAGTETFSGKTIDTANNTFKLNGAAFGTATQATAALNAMVGDAGSGGTKGLVPAPGSGDAAAAKFLKADGSWAVPAGGGGGGSLPDDVRQNVLLNSIYQSKTFAEYLRRVVSFATGFKGATDTKNGILTGSSSNYTVTPGTAGDTTGNVAPNSTGGSSVVPTMTSATTSGVTFSATSVFGTGNEAFRAGDKILTYGASGVWLSAAGVNATLTVDLGTAQTIATYKCTNDFTGGQSGMSQGWNFQGSNNGTTWTTLDTQTGQFTSGGATTNTYPISSPGSYRYYQWVTTARGSSYSGFIEVDLLPAGSTNNMTVVTALQTADATVSNGRVLIEFDGTASPTLNTDLTVEVTCDGGTHWTAASLSSVTTHAQGGRYLAETVDQATTGGTSFAARIKTLTNKNIPIYGLSLTVH